MNETTIHIRESSGGDGYIYDIYDVAPDDVEFNDPVDGGLCTSNIKNAIEMAFNQTIQVVDKHILKIISLHDAMAECSCGWNMSFTGKMTREQIQSEHLKHVNQEAPPKYCPRCKEDWTDVKKINKGALVESECKKCGVCKECEHLSDCINSN